MSILLNPYLGFDSNAREAMEFYHLVFGGELTISTFAEYQANEGPADADKIMHSMLTTPGGLVLMASDAPPHIPYNPGTNHAVSLSGAGAADDAELRRYWHGLSDGGVITMPLELAPWGDSFGMCTDKFGISWLVNIQSTPN